MAEKINNTHKLTMHNILTNFSDRTEEPMTFYCIRNVDPDFFYNIVASTDIDKLTDWIFFRDNSEAKEINLNQFRMICTLISQCSISALGSLLEIEIPEDIERKLTEICINYFNKIFSKSFEVMLSSYIYTNNKDKFYTIFSLCYNSVECNKARTFITAFLDYIRFTILVHYHTHILFDANSYREFMRDTPKIINKNNVELTSSMKNWNNGINFILTEFQNYEIIHDNTELNDFIIKCMVILKWLITDSYYGKVLQSIKVSFEKATVDNEN